MHVPMQPSRHLHKSSGMSVRPSRVHVGEQPPEPETADDSIDRKCAEAIFRVDTVGLLLPQRYGRSYMYVQCDYVRPCSMVHAHVQRSSEETAD
jgi:hypothetical protein